MDKKVRPLPLYLIVAVLLAAPLAGCETEGPAERAGESIDRSVDRAGESMEEAGEKIRERSDR